MVVLQDDTFAPLMIAGVVLFFSAFVLGAVMQNWDVALFKPSPNAEDNVVFGDSTAIAYMIIGFFHFGGMISGVALASGSLLTLLLAAKTAQRVRALLLASVLPLGFGVTFFVWVLYTLPGFGWVFSAMRVDRAWVSWATMQGVLLVYLSVRFAYDVLR